MEQIDFDKLSSFLLLRIRDLLSSWLPGGKLIGHEWTCADLRGGQGGSCKVNINSGKWADFASDIKGGDLISLYAAIQGLNQGQAAKQLTQEYNYLSTDLSPVKISREMLPAAPPPLSVPLDAPIPTMWHPEYGTPTAYWIYRNLDGDILYYNARYNTSTGKEFIPWTWNGAKWHAKAYQTPRPLYGLNLLSSATATAPILIVEGERTADAARSISGVYTVISWSGGAKAVTKADWSPIYGRKILIWPDADRAGQSAANAISDILSEYCPEIKIINIPDNSRPTGWDAADAVSDGWTNQKFYEWAKPLAVTIQVNQTITNTLNLTQNITQSPEDDHAVPSESMYAVWERLGLALSQSGYPINNEDNVARIFEGEPALGSRLWFDEFYNSVFIETPNGGRELKSLDIFKLTMYLQRSYGMSRISDAAVKRAILILADRVRKNEPRDWMETLKWDGTPRIQQFCHTHLGAADTPYTRAVSKNFWISMAARIYNPGCIMRTMLILKAKQWAGKSTAFSIIGGKWYAEALESIQSNNFLQSLHGKMLIEFADMSGMDRAEVNRIKQVISCRMDRFRAPYDPAPNDHQRRCVLVSTTNEGNFLRDDTGGSRFWPVETTRINHEAITADRDQLFAEAVHCFKAGEKWHIMPTEETEAIQEAYRQTDEWEIIIEEFLSSHNLFTRETTVSKLALECLKIPVDRLDKSTQIRIARNLTSIGWEKHQKRDGEKVVKVWRPRVYPDTNEGEAIEFD